MVESRKPNFTIKNDVWGFSVLLYEIYSKGKLPYGKVIECELFDNKKLLEENMRDNYKIYEYLSEGIGKSRLERPENTPDDIYVSLTVLM